MQPIHDTHVSKSAIELMNYQFAPTKEDVYKYLQSNRSTANSIILERLPNEVPVTLPENDIKELIDERQYLSNSVNT